VEVLLAVGGGLVALWLVLLVALAVGRPSELGVKDALRLLPDVLRLVRDLVRDPSLPRGVRVRLWLLLGYLVMPIDLVPDFVPVLGYADDAVVVVVARGGAALRRTAGRCRRPGAALDRDARGAVGRAAPRRSRLTCRDPSTHA
jgi:uncharacterized membrane protein YkvA (DUF1232 family)